MKKLAILGSFALVAATASTSFAYYPGNYWRCTADYLGGSPSSSLQFRHAYGRTTWAKNAHTFLKNIGNPTQAARYWDPSWMDAEVNQAATQYNVDLYPVYQDTSSPTGVWIGPGPNNTAQWYGTTYDQIKTRPYALPNPNTSVVGLCEPGCYMPEQEILFGDGFAPIAEAQEADQRTVMTLAPNANFGKLELIPNTVARWTTDLAPAEQTIITLRMKSGGELKVTTEHPILTSEGVMKRAADLVVGESLVRQDGSPDPIESLDRATVFTKVYNLRPTTTDLLSNILVAQGYLNGSARYQSEYVQYLNRVLMRKNIPAELIPRSGTTSTRKERAATPVATPRQLLPSPRRK